MNENQEKSSKTKQNASSINKKQRFPEVNVRVSKNS